MISPDGVHWEMMQDEPIITDGKFDSQNLAFWDEVRSEYRAYIRDFHSYETHYHITAHRTYSLVFPRGTPNGNGSLLWMICRNRSADGTEPISENVLEPR